MAKKEQTPVTVTQTMLISCTIEYKQQQLRKYEEEAEQAEQLDAKALAGGLRQTIAKLEKEIELLHKLYKIETGTEYGF